jgi:hypothetical protein
MKEKKTVYQMTKRMFVAILNPKYRENGVVRDARFLEVPTQSDTRVVLNCINLSFGLRSRVDTIQFTN